MATQSTVLSLRLPASERSRLERLARRRGRTVGELAARMVVEGRRREDFPWIDFRESAVGRIACLQGTRLPVWWLVRITQQFKGDARRAAGHLDLPLIQLQAAFNYAQAFPEEIELAIRDYEQVTVEDLRRDLPNLEVFEASAKPRGPRK
jgi:uncharacterized protein (DUF433 family)